MTTQYRELFRIRCRHGYFADQRCRVLALTPTAECNRLLDRYRCLFRAAADGGAVYCGEQNGQNMLRLFDETTPFAFALDNRDPAFETFTEMDSGRTGAPAESLYYFSNAREYVDIADERERLLLHPPGNAFTGGRLPVRPARFVYGFPKGEAKLQLFDAFQRQVWNSDKPAGDIGPGCYQLRTNGGNAYDFYLSAAAARHWGLVEIFAGGPALAKTLPENCQVLDAKGIFCAGQSFTISMEARRSFWRYYIVSGSTADRMYDGYRIVADPPRSGKTKSGEGIVFSAPVRQKVGDKDAWVFESTTPIPLSEIPGDRHEFTLRSDGRTGGGVSSVTLPYGQPANTRLENGPRGGQCMWSEVYVYL